MRIFHVLGTMGRIVTDPEQKALSGIGNAVMNIAAAQVKQGHQVTVCGFSDPFPPGTSNWEGVNIIALRRWHWSRLPGLDLSLLLPVNKQILHHIPIDILHVHAEMGLLYLPFARRRILHLHGLPSMPGKHYQHLLRHANGVVCCSHYIFDRFQEAVDYPAKQTFVVHNGALPCSADTKEVEKTRQNLGLQPGQVGILFVGAIVADKGLHILVQALRDLDNPEVKTFIVGSSRLWLQERAQSEYEQQLQKAAQGLNITWLGNQPHQEVVKLQQACDLLVLPSIVQEAHPLVVCEAMAAGKPVIASRVGGIPETVMEDQTGLLFPAGDHAALAASIRQLVQDPVRRNRMGLASVERSRMFTWDAAAEYLDHVYATLG